MTNLEFPTRPTAHKINNQAKAIGTEADYDEPSLVARGSCGCEPGVGTRHSLKAT